MADNHCWHETGEHLLSHPPRRRQKCCHCGGLREVHSGFGDRSGHGRFCPPVVVDAVVCGPAGACPARGESEAA